MSWIERFLKEDELVVRDRYNRKRLIAQRKWIILFYSIAYVFLTDRLNLSKQIGPFDLTNFSDESLISAFLIANLLIFIYSIIQLPSFVLNYPSYLRDSFANLRANENIEDRETIEKLRTEQRETEHRRHEVRNRIEELTEAEHTYQDLVGSNPPQRDEELATARSIAEQFGFDYKPTLLQSIRRELRTSDQQFFQLEENLERIRKDIFSLEEKLESGLNDRSKRFRVYVGTEILTDLTRVLPILLLGVASIVTLQKLSVAG